MNICIFPAELSAVLWANPSEQSTIVDRYRLYLTPVSFKRFKQERKEEYMSGNANSEMVARTFVEARSTGRAIARYPAMIPTSLTEGYEIQDHAIALDGRPVAGWKVGKIGPENEAVFGCNRLVGPIFSNEIFEYHSQSEIVMPVFQDGFAAVEAELLLRIGETPLRAYNIDDVGEIIDEVRIGLEIASSPYSGINRDGPAVTASDFGNNKGVVLGHRLDHWRSLDLLEMPVVTSIDDQVVGRADMRSMLDGPFGSVVFLIDLLRARNIVISPGTWVSAGAITGVHDILPGQKAVARFADTWDVSCRIGTVEQRPL